MNDITLLNSIPELATLDKQQVAKITERLPDFHRGKALIGHSTSQTSYSLQTMNILLEIIKLQLIQKKDKCSMVY